MPAQRTGSVNTNKKPQNTKLTQEAANQFWALCQQSHDWFHIAVRVIVFILIDPPLSVTSASSDQGATNHTAVLRNMFIIKCKMLFKMTPLRKTQCVFPCPHYVKHEGYEHRGSNAFKSYPLEGTKRVKMCNHSQWLH